MGIDPLKKESFLIDTKIFQNHLLMKKIILMLFLIFCTNLLCAQNNYQNHTVKSGETVYSISKMYMISEETIYIVKSRCKACHQNRVDFDFTIKWGRSISKS